MTARLQQGALAARRRLGPREVLPVGLGCMNLSHAYGVPPSARQAERVLRQALELGVELFDTAALYGFGANEELVGRVLTGQRSRVLLASKGGMAGVEGKRVIDGRPQALRRNCEDSLRRLRTDVIDLYYLHRWDKAVPIEESVGLLGELVREGKVRSIGLSEVSAATLRRAYAVHPIAAVQNEYSLWTRNPEIAMLDACRELDVALVAFSPLARGFLTGGLREVDSLAAKDIRRGMPRFQPQTYARNLELLPPYEALAARLGCTPAQLALGWLLAQDARLVAIPGTTSVEHLRENFGALRLRLPDDALRALRGMIHQGNVHGARYAPSTLLEIDAEGFEP